MLIVGVRGIIAVDVLAELYKTKQEEVFFHRCLLVLPFVGQ